MLAAEGLQVGGGVDVGDRGELLVGVEHRREFAPGALDLGQVGHVGHRTAGGEVRQDGNLFGAREDVRHLGHEVHAAEDDELGVGLRSQPGKLQRIAGQVGMLEDVGALVVVAEDDRALAEARPCGANALLGVFVGEGVEAVEADGGGLHGVFGQLGWIGSVGPGMAKYYQAGAGTIRRHEQRGASRLDAAADRRQSLPRGPHGNVGQRGRKPGPDGHANRRRHFRACPESGGGRLPFAGRSGGRLHGAGGQLP